MEGWSSCQRLSFPQPMGLRIAVFVCQRFSLFRWMRVDLSACIGLTAVPAEQQCHTTPIFNSVVRTFQSASRPSLLPLVHHRAGAGGWREVVDRRDYFSSSLAFARADSPIFSPANILAISITRKSPSTFSSRVTDRPASSCLSIFQCASAWPAI